MPAGWWQHSSSGGCISARARLCDCKLGGYILTRLAGRPAVCLQACKGCLSVQADRMPGESEGDPQTGRSLSLLYNCFVRSKILATRAFLVMSAKNSCHLW